MREAWHRPGCGVSRLDVRVLDPPSLRIVIVMHHQELGGYGAEGVTRELVGAWRSMGHVVRVLSFSDLPTPFQGSRLAPVVFPWWVATVLWRSDADLVDATTGDTWVLGLLWKLRRRRPFLAVRSHGLEHLAEQAHVWGGVQDGLSSGWARQLYFARYRLFEVAVSVRFADVFRALNARESVWASARLGARAVVVGGNGVSDVFFMAQPARQDSPLRLVAVGRWERQKGRAALVAVLNQIRDVLPRTELLLLGTGADSRSVLADFPFTEGVFVRPTCTPSEIAAALAQSHLYLSMSRSEGFSVALLEAMAVGCVPVVTDVGAARELVAGQDVGVVVDVGDAVGAANAVISLAGDPARREALSQRNREVAGRMTWDVVAQGTLATYRAAGMCRSRGGK